MPAGLQQFFRTLPVGKTVSLGVLLFVSAAFALFCWWMQLSTEREAAIVEDKLTAQQTLSLPYARLVAREQSLVKLLARTPARPVPADLPGLITSLETVAKEAELPGMRFVPDAVSVVGSTSLRFTASADGTTENFRRFLLRLSDQPWVLDLESIEIKAGAPLHTLTLRFKATCRELQKRQGGAS